MATKHQCPEINRHTGDRRCREAYRIIKQINWKWKPTQSAIKDRDGKMLQGIEVTMKRWTEYCSSRYTNTGNSGEVGAELEQITHDQRKMIEMHDIFYDDPLSMVITGYTTANVTPVLILA